MWKPASIPIRFFPLLLLLLPLTYLLLPSPTTRTPFFRSTPFLPPPSCHFIGHNPSLPTPLNFNTRSLCLHSSLCVSSKTPSSSIFHPSFFPPPICTFHTSSLTPLPPFPTSCAKLQKEAVLCAHGVRNPSEPRANCPTILPLNATHLSSATWFETLSLIIPDFPYAGNIFHYASVAALVAYVIENLPTFLLSWGPDSALSGFQSCVTCPPFDRWAVDLVFRHPADILARQVWQRQLMHALVTRRLQSVGYRVRVRHLAPGDSDRVLCWRNAVWLGGRVHVNMWPFPNDTRVPLTGYAVPQDAVAFKRAVYDAFGVAGRLPRGKGEVSELPPRVVGYAKRGEQWGNRRRFVESYEARRFSEEDEEWFVQMLEDECKAGGMALEVLTPKAGDELKKQVRNMAKVGFVVGIHGANLANAMFMRPFGGLFEIFPKGVAEECYIAGMNSGLGYWKYEAREMATAEESGCRKTDLRCRDSVKQRLVKIGGEEDRRSVRELVRKGIQHVNELHRRFPEGIPVRYNRNTSYFDILVS